ncbi:MAG: sulfite exporter TauE/SafE family protein [Candidatus Izemoplasma sp.]
MEYILIALIGLFSGVIKGSSGFGSSLVALPLLIFFFDINDVVVIMITINVALNFIMLFEYKGFSFKNLKEVWVIVVCGIIFTFIGLELLETVDEKIVKYFAATLILIAVLNKSFKLKIEIKDSHLFQAIAGSISGFSNGIASIDGPPIVFYLTSIKAEKIKFKNTLVSYFLVLGVVSVILLFIKGSYTIDIMLATGYIGIFLIIGTLFGMIISKRINEENFDRFVTILLIGLGISMFI